MSGAPQRDEFSRSVRRGGEVAQPAGPSAARLRGREDNRDLRLNVSGKPAETTGGPPLPMTEDDDYPEYTPEHERGGAEGNQESLSKEGSCRSKSTA
jgi:hypothetical protein